MWDDTTYMPDVSSPSLQNFLGIDCGLLNAVVSSSSNMEPTAVSVAISDVSNCAKPLAAVVSSSSNMEPAA
eukprot:8508066-Prorocentrum_lima.AAC.1